MRRAAFITLLMTAPLGACYYELEPVEIAPDLAVPDLGQDLTGIDATDDGPRCRNGAVPHHAGELTDPPLDRWGAEPLEPLNAMPATATVVLDPARVVIGAGSLRLDTSNGQAGVLYPATRDAHFDLTPYLYASFSLTADNADPQSDPGWQGAQPRLLLVSSREDYFEYLPETNRVPRTPGTMVGMTVPLAGGSGWIRNQYGMPDLHDVRYLALTFDSWGTGFTVWIDDLRFGPAQFLDCPE